MSVLVKLFNSIYPCTTCMHAQEVNGVGHSCYHADCMKSILQFLIVFSIDDISISTLNFNTMPL